ncbi:MAG: phenylalanine--tRNA ligase subunit alpha [Nanoarchaeota archaeon]|jgi:phenylalanyl-tRNA synthetase alpha chain|nr:phenylalanine--tRNA ligase subunit alpha [Nanoarchaeota archaeon]
MEKLIDSLSPNEKKVLPHLEDPISEICKKSNLDKVAVLRALDFLANKELIELTTEKKKIIDVDVNGALYRKKGLPERRLLLLLDTKRIIPLQEAQKESGLSADEFKASIGALKKKALIDLKNGKIILNASKEEVSKKSLEEMLLEVLPLEESSLTPEQIFAIKILQKRKHMILTEETKLIQITITDLGKEIMHSKELGRELIEQITPEILRSEKNWKGKKFRRYDLSIPAPRIYGGKRHFVNLSTDYARKVWTEMGFKEMKGNLVVSSFWNFDALFTAQDHPVREMQDTFFIDKKTELPDKKIIERVKLAHEKGIGGSRGWRYNWQEEDSKKMLLRTHTTSLTSQTLAKLTEKDIPAKFFAVGKCFRNETVDWSHGFEFNQTEGIVIDPDANFRHLLGYLKQFAKKMGLEKVRFRPAYFPYTEPSVEGDVWDEERKEWIELFAAGMLRPEVTTALFGKHIPTLAWGPGIDRIIIKMLGIKDLRDLYKNDLNQLRNIKTLIRI